MKYLVLLLFFPGNFVFTQNMGFRASSNYIEELGVHENILPEYGQIKGFEGSDSVERTLINRLFVSQTKNHNHIIDYTIYGINLAYNYWYRLSSRLFVGARIGTSYSKSNWSIPLASQNYQLGWNESVVANVVIWRSFNLGTSFGLRHAHIWPMSTNTFQTNNRTEYYGVFSMIDINFSLFEHAFFRGGLAFTHDRQAQFWGNSTVIQVGWRF